MPKDRFAASNVTRYELADGQDWVDLKNNLTWGERMRLTADSSVIETATVPGDDGIARERDVARTDWGLYWVRRMAAYLAAWSLVGPDEKTVTPISVATISALTEEAGDELGDLLNAHIRALETLKNAPPSASGGTTP